MIKQLLNLFKRPEPKSASDRMGGPAVARINKDLQQYIGQKASDVQIALMKKFPTYWIVNGEETPFINCDFRFDRILIIPDKDGKVQEVDIG